MKAKLTMDIEFTFQKDSPFLGRSQVRSCDVCGQRHRNHGLAVHFSGFRGAEHGPAFAEEGVFYGYSVLCADCILSSPGDLAERLRARAEEVLRKPNIRRKQRVEAEGMFELADELAKVRDLKDLPGGVLAARIAEAYRELDNSPKARKGAAA